MSDALIKILEEKGYTEEAESLRRRDAAEQLRFIGRPDLADALTDGSGAGTAPSSPPAPEPTQSQREAAAVRQALEEAGVVPRRDEGADAEQRFAEGLRDAITEAQSPWWKPGQSATGADDGT